MADRFAKGALWVLVGILVAGAIAAGTLALAGRSIAEPAAQPVPPATTAGAGASERPDPSPGRSPSRTPSASATESPSGGTGDHSGGSGGDDHGGSGSGSDDSGGSGSGESHHDD
jgi:hypothetical protein